MRRQNAIRTFLFVVFFGIGAAALSTSILCNDLLRYYTNKQLLKKVESNLNHLQTLNDDYAALLEQLEKDPNFAERIASATLGTQQTDPNTIYPEITASQLYAARKVLAENFEPQPADTGIPGWLTRCSKPSRRTALFLTGGSLILISFMCFGPAKQKAPK